MNYTGTVVLVTGAAGNGICRSAALSFAKAGASVVVNYLKNKAGADAVVCTVPGVPVLLCFADCVPVVVVCSGGFAVVHSGWRGTYAEIAGTAFCQETGLG